MLDLGGLSDAIEAHGIVARVVVAEAKGSTPREAGAAMLVWAGGMSGTIGGGRLELDAMGRAQQMLNEGSETAVTRQPLGPALKQCCGGAVTLVTEVYDATRYRVLDQGFEFQGIWARAVAPYAGPLPDAARRKIEKMQWGDMPFPITLTGGWLIEPVWRDMIPVYIYGAGHVGRALAQVLAPVPGLEVFLVDVRPHQFDDLPGTFHHCFQTLPTEIMAAAPPEAAHFIMTPDHDYDLTLCHQLLQQPFAYAGLIGSETKWARFRKRLVQMGHKPAEIERIHCPIGDPSLGKHPQAIAVGVAAELMKTKDAVHIPREKSA